MKEFRQGDVLIFQLPSTVKLPTGKKLVDGRRTVLAYGEVTGHAHALPAKDATLFESDLDALEALKKGKDLLSKLNLGATDRVLRVHTKTVLRHEEHDPITLKKGDYIIRIQREYSPGNIRNVAD